MIYVSREIPSQDMGRAEKMDCRANGEGKMVMIMPMFLLR
jgi:hypothetical protein